MKKEHVGVIPGISEYVTEFTSDRAIGSEGYLVDKGLIPLPDGERTSVQKEAVGLPKLSL